MKRVAVLVSSFALAALAGCGDHDHHAVAAPAGEEITHLVCVIHPSSGSSCRGVVHFTAVGGKVQIVADLEGLTPNQEHAFHVHEFGDCSSPDGESAGGHYNPEKHPHGNPAKDAQRHAGDFGNLKAADAQGKTHHEMTVDNITLAGARNPVLGRSLIVHAKPDDFGQPTGNAGGRIGCGAIGVAKPKSP